MRCGAKRPGESSTFFPVQKKVAVTSFVIQYVKYRRASKTGSGPSSNVRNSLLPEPVILNSCIRINNPGGKGLPYLPDHLHRHLAVKPVQLFAQPSRPGLRHAAVDSQL
ncbi:MAG: hypothetical protein MZV63_67540 [Marinilabiliales bacterium]|nr:hypothetical protein [Marinilabiliales bacterium]